jgi:DNA-binding NtrC family response regulator
MNPATDKNIRIFVVDDDELSVKMARFHLRLNGYSDVNTYSNGLACLNNLSLKPEIIFLDQYMDGLSGLEVLKRIKDSDSSIQIVMVSGEESDSTAAEFIRHGALEYIVKGPHMVEKMVAAIQKVAGKQQSPIK